MISVCPLSKTWAGHEIGFVALKGHFLDKDLIDELYTQVRLLTFR